MVNGVKTYQPQLGRRNPNFAAIWQRVTDASSFYNSAQFSLNRKYADGWRAQMSYTLSRSIDDSSGINSQDFSNVVQYGLDWHDPQYDRGLPAFNVKHNFTANGSWELPIARGRANGVHRRRRGWIADCGADVGAHHVNGDDRASDSIGRQADVSVPRFAVGPFTSSRLPVRKLCSSS